MAMGVFERATAVLRTVHEKRWAPVSVKSRRKHDHLLEAKQEQRVVRENEQRLARGSGAVSFDKRQVRAFRDTRLNESIRATYLPTQMRATRAWSDTGPERRVFPILRADFPTRRVAPRVREARPVYIDTAAPHIPASQRAVQRRSTPAFSREVERGGASAVLAPSLVWHKREIPLAPPVKTAETVTQAATARTVRTASTPSSQRVSGAPFDRATMDRLAEDVMSRIDRRLRLERERRGL
jgi:hypothetical protein